MDRFGPTVKVPNEGQVSLSLDVSQVVIAVVIVMSTL